MAIINKIVDCIKNIQPYIQFAYSFISVLSTLAIFSAVVMFLIGKTRLGDACDDDLTMQRIKKKLPDNLTMSKIYMRDIHGLGNDSMIVLAVDNEEDSRMANQLLIFDRIENDILNQFNNLFGYGSNYRLSYKFSLKDLYYETTQGYELEFIDLVELTGDISKEIVVKFMPYPAGNGAYYSIGIFSYSYEKHTYELIGTYPPPGRQEVNKTISTVFHAADGYQSNYYNNNENKLFRLEYGSKYDNDFFAKAEHFATVLIRTARVWGDEGNADPHRFDISMFSPVYDSDVKELKWEVLFSKETDEYVDYCSKEYVQNFLENESWLYKIDIE